MSPEVTVPGVYVDETPSAARAIESVPTSVAAFVGYTAEGPVNTPVRVGSFEDFEREFGDADPASDLSYAAEQFFLNGGSTAWVVRVVGATNPSMPTPAELVGSETERTGLYALEDVDLFNLLLLPNQSDHAVHAAMIAYAEQRRAFAILDPPATLSTVQEALNWTNSTLRHANGAAYFPRLLFADPDRGGQPRPFANSGAVAGVYARTDAQRGVWKAPAGTAATVHGAVGLEQPMTDDENGLINPAGLNALRRFPTGVVVWGARTLVGADTLASEWKYVPVRRTALFLQESLARGLAWTVFEPNDESLWAQVRSRAEAFMHNLFRVGAFTGATARDAYFVKCDRETTTASDISNGATSLVVGFAPIKPAEFILFKIALCTQKPSEGGLS